MSEKNLGIIGGGQLGSLLSVAAKKLNIKTTIYCDDINAPAQNFCNDFIIGKYDESGELLLPSNGVLDPIVVGKAIVNKLIGLSKSEKLELSLNSLSIDARSEANTPAPDRIPYFCSG